MELFKETNCHTLFLMKSTIFWRMSPYIFPRRIFNEYYNVMMRIIKHKVFWWHCKNRDERIIGKGGIEPSQSLRWGNIKGTIPDYSRSLRDENYLRGWEKWIYMKKTIPDVKWKKREPSQGWLPWREINRTNPHQKNGERNRENYSRAVGPSQKRNLGGDWTGPFQRWRNGRGMKRTISKLKGCESNG